MYKVALSLERRVSAYVNNSSAKERGDSREWVRKVNNIPLKRRQKNNIKKTLHQMKQRTKNKAKEKKQKLSLKPYMNEEKAKEPAKRMSSVHYILTRLASCKDACL